MDAGVMYLTFPLRGRARKARVNSFDWTAFNLWNLLPRCVRDISGKDVWFFKNKKKYRDQTSCGQDS